MNMLRRLGIAGYVKYVRPMLYAVREWWPLWFYIINRSPRKLYMSQQVQLSLVEKRLTEELLATGIALTSIDELFGGIYTLEELRTYVQHLPPPTKEEISMKKQEVQTRLWSVRPELNLSNPFVKLTLDKRVLHIVNTYMQMWSKLQYYDLAVTHPVPKNSAAQFSQRWHRDPEEKRMCKMFIYLTDVGEGNGPFTYVPGSPFAMSPYGHFFPQRPPDGCYPDAKDVERVIPETDRRRMTGKAGTIIFCDTSGLHRGGYATEGERLMFTAAFAAPSSTQEVWYHQKTPPPDSLDNAARYALTH